MRTPALTPQKAESALGRVRGQHPHLFVNSDNHSVARQWLTANGVSGAYAAKVSRADIARAFNDTTDKLLGQIRADDAAWQAGQRPVALPEGGAIKPENDSQIQRIAALLGELLSKPQGVDESAVRDIVRQEIAGIAPRQIEVRNGDKPVVHIDGVLHPCFQRVLNIVAQGENVLLVGPSGCGKTHMASMIAKALSVSYGAIHGSAGASESALTGWLLPSEGGRFDYTPSLFINLYEAGESLFLFDELDAFDPNMLLVANGALSNGHLFVAHRKSNPCVTRGKNARIMATANTYGTGANPMYAGRAPLDAATLDRFVVVTMDYDRKLEESIGRAGGLEAHEMADLWALRDKVREQELRRCISTRAFQKACSLKAAGDSWNTVKATLVEGWSRDERAQVGMK